MIRVAFHWEMDDSRLDPAPYHGGELQDELTALVSLLLGIRARTTRTFIRAFDESGDPLGRVVHTEEPILVPEVPLFSREILPRTMLPRRLSAAFGLFASLPEMEWGDAGVLVTAARLYQEAVWISNIDAARAWLLLVSAVETVAHHAQSQAASALDRMRASRPQLARILIDEGSEELAEKVAVLIADYMGATKKFRDFLLSHLPEPPDPRVEEEAYRVPWDKKFMKRAFEQIYDYRSRTLHGGVAFPFPLCQPPAALEERPTFDSIGHGTHSWSNKEVPMLLHVFEHIVRGALLDWWRETIARRLDSA